MKTLYYKFMAFVVTWLMRLLPRNLPIVYAGAGSSTTMAGQAKMLGFDKVLLVTDEFLGGSGVFLTGYSQLCTQKVPAAAVAVPPELRRHS